MHLEFDPLLFAHKHFMCLAFYGAESANQREVSLDEATQLHDSCPSVAEEQNMVGHSNSSFQSFTCHQKY